MTFDELALATGANTADAIRYAEPLSAAMALFDITGKSNRAAFLATVSVESVRLSKVEEDLFYKDAARLASIYKRAFKSAAEAQPYTRSPRKLSELLYGGYHGRGLIQLTWLDNYVACGRALGRDFVTDPSVVCEPTNAALSAAWFWSHNGCRVPAERGDMRGVTRIVNGPALMHLAERQEQYEVAMGVLAHG